METKAKRFFNTKLLIVALVLTGVFLFLSHLPPEVTPSRLQAGGLDKLAHMLGYGVITLLFFLALRSSASLLSGFVRFIAIMAVSAVDELTQPFVNRTASLADWLADIVVSFNQPNRKKPSDGLCTPGLL